MMEACKEDCDKAILKLEKLYAVALSSESSTIVTDSILFLKTCRARLPSKESLEKDRTRRKLNTTKPQG